MKTVFNSLLLLICINVQAQQVKHDNQRFHERNMEARTLIRDGKLEEAENLIKELASPGAAASPSDEAVLHTTQGALNMSRGRNDLALDHLERALAHWNSSGKGETLDAAETQAYLGNLLRATGKYNQAEEHLSLALLTRRKLLPANDEQIAASLNDLGLVYTQSDLDKALDHYEAALKIYESVKDSDAKVAIAKTNIGYLYSRQELYGDAVNNLEAALAVWNKVYTSDHPAKAFVLFSLGQTYERMKNTSTARLYYEQSLAMYQKTYPDKHPEISRVLNALGNLSRSADDFEAALSYYQKALISNHTRFTDSEIDVNPAIRNYYDGNVLLYSLMYKAQALELQYLRKTLRFADLALALQSLHSCDSLIDRLRHQITNESDKIALGAIANEVYADGVRISFLAAQAAWKKKEYYEKAFFFSEKSKAAVLLGAISDSNAKSFAGIPAATLEEERQLKSAMTLCAQKLAQKPEPKEEEYLRRTYADLTRTYDAFTRRLEKEYPSYYNLKYNSFSPSPAALQQKLGPQTMMLSYFIDEKNAALYTFRLTAESYEVFERNIPADFDRNITGLRNSLYFSELSVFRQAAGGLSTLLLPKKISSRIKEIIIIPTARLSTIPFETLLTAPAAESDTYSTLPYVVKKYSVRYEFSASLVLQKEGRQSNSGNGILLCAPVMFASAKMPDLPGTETEVKDISSLFQKRELPSSLLLGKDAYKQKLQETDLRKYAYLHFATHGVVDEMQPDLSRIVLMSERGTDGALYAGDIYNLELDAQLVTLSACETGLGKISRGEGVIGLSRALVYAGARNCIVSFWKVSDESTALMMKSYYARLLDSPTRSLSATLQQTKIEMINHEKYSAPFYWAPFILIGF